LERLAGRSRQRLEHTLSLRNAAVINRSISPGGDRAGPRLYCAGMREAWITGIGLVSALGPDRETTWGRLVAGATGIRPITLFDTTGYRTAIAAQVADATVCMPSLPSIVTRHASR